MKDKTSLCSYFGYIMMPSGVVFIICKHFNQTRPPKKDGRIIPLQDIHKKSCTVKRLHNCHSRNNPQIKRTSVNVKK